MRCDLKLSVAALWCAARPILLAALLTGTAAALAGCGQKGPLSLPTAPAAAVPASAAAAPSAPVR